MRIERWRETPRVNLWPSHAHTCTHVYRHTKTSVHLYLCVYVCMHLCICVCSYICTYLYEYVYAPCVPVCIYVCTCVCLSVCISMSVTMCICVCLYAYVLVSMCLPICICMYVHTCAHKYMWVRCTCAWKYTCVYRCTCGQLYLLFLRLFPLCLFESRSLSCLKLDNSALLTGQGALGICLSSFSPVLGEALHQALYRASSKPTWPCMLKPLKTLSPALYWAILYGTSVDMSTGTGALCLPS